MRWVHLTDIHLTPDREDAQRAALREQFADLERLLAGATVDAVLISGDIANSGKDPDYKLADRLLIEPIRRNTLLRDVPIVCVPGNHDLNSEVSVPTRLSDWDPRRRELFWSPGEAGESVREPQARAFTAYSAFRQRNGLHGVDPLREVASLLELRTSDGVSAIVSCNTAFFSHPQTKDEGTQEPPTAGLRDVVAAAKGVVAGEGTVLVVGHHPLRWFAPTDLDRLRQLLRSSHALYLHGHEHVVRVEYTNGGALSFGFSASFQSAMDVNPSPYYRNSYALCEVRDGILHFGLRKWDAESGKWTPESVTPVGVDEESDRIQSGFVIPILRRTPTRASSSSTVHLGSSVRLPPDVASIRPIMAWTEQDWREIMVRLGIVPQDASKSANVMRSEGQSLLFSADQGGERWLVNCIAGSGHVLARGEVTDANTEMDIENAHTYILVTPGTVSEDARTTHQRLVRSGKRLIVMAGPEFASKILSSASGKLTGALRTLDGGEVAADLAFGERTLWLVLRDRVKSAWFRVVSESGDVVPASALVVKHVRSSFDMLKGASYLTSSESPKGMAAWEVTTEVTPFDRVSYLQSCKKEFNSIRYAGLATAGPRLQNVPLTLVHVGANADVETGQASTTGIVGAIESTLDMLNLDPRIRQQLQQQIYRAYGLSPNRETYAAQAAYQRFGSVGILGDPGSGKTCFTKHQILQYCDSEAGSWYARHVPVYVPLAAAAKLIADGIAFEAIICRLAAERGLQLEEEHLTGLLSAGEVAFFFDGLDEVDRLEHRVEVVATISQVMSKYGAVGNRFVLTSRPAAIQLVKLPTELRVISLRGLGEDDIRLLAERVLRAQRSILQDLAQGTISELLPISDDDRKIVEQILADCKGSPAIFRLARNPLLLTLLVTIYSNSGQPAAKRHRVYTQAVQTLVAARARVAGHTPMAESELRKRLGDLALSQFERSLGSVIRKADAIEVVSRSMSEQLGVQVSERDAERFIRDVADSTGLLVIHEGVGASEPVIGFMHHSFYEYYAANGLLRGDYVRALPLLVHEPQWREVLLLLAGLSDERDDVSPLVEAVLSLDDEVTPVTLENLLIAFDCALESEVPPERAQMALFRRITSAVSEGPLRADYALRNEVGKRLTRLASLTGSRHLREFLLRGLSSADVVERITHIDFVGSVGSETRLDQSIVDAFESAAKGQVAEAEGNDVAIAILNAAARCEQLRSKVVLQILQAALSGGAALKHAAASAVADAPGLAAGSREWERLQALLDDKNAVVAGTAATALIRGRIRLLPDTQDGRSLLLKMLRRLEDDTGVEVREKVCISFSQSDIDSLMSSDGRADRLLGIRLLPWLKGLDTYVYQRLLGAIRANNDADEVVAALSALRLSESCHGLLSMADVDNIADLLRLSRPNEGTGRVVAPSTRRDIRLSALRCLVVVGRSRVISRRIIDYLRSISSTSDVEEYTKAIHELRALPESVPEIVNFVCDELDRRLPSKGSLPRFSESRVAELRELLELYAEQDLDENEERALQYIRLARDFHVPAALRRSMLVAAAAASVPSMAVVNKWLELLNRPPDGMADLVARGVEEFTRKCRRQLDWIRQVYPYLPEIRAALVDAYRRTWFAVHNEPSMGGQRMVYFRLALSSVQFTYRSYRDVASRQRETDDAVSGDGVTE